MEIAVTGKYRPAYLKASCAPRNDRVEALVHGLPRAARIFNLQPACLQDTLDSVTALGAAAGVPERAALVRTHMEERMARY